MHTRLALDVYIHVNACVYRALAGLSRVYLSRARAQTRTHTSSRCRSLARIAHPLNPAHTTSSSTILFTSPHFLAVSTRESSSNHHRHTAVTVDMRSNRRPPTRNEAQTRQKTHLSHRVARSQNDPRVCVSLSSNATATMRASAMLPNDYHSRANTNRPRRAANRP